MRDEIMKMSLSGFAMGQIIRIYSNWMCLEEQHIAIVHYTTLSLLLPMSWYRLYWMHSSVYTVSVGESVSVDYTIGASHI